MIRVILILQTAQNPRCSVQRKRRVAYPERVQHMRTFPIFEIGFVGGIVRVGFALHFNVSFNGCALGAVQPHLARLSLVIVAFPEEILLCLRLRS